MSDTDDCARFAAMEDVRISRLGLVNFIGVHLIILVVFAVYAYTGTDVLIYGLPAGVWLMIVALPIVWLQFYVYINRSEAKLAAPADDGPQDDTREGV